MGVNPTEGHTVLKVDARKSLDLTIFRASLFGPSLSIFLPSHSYHGFPLLLLAMKDQFEEIASSRCPIGSNFVRRVRIAFRLCIGDIPRLVHIDELSHSITTLT